MPHSWPALTLCAAALLWGGTAAASGPDGEARPRIVLLAQPSEVEPAAVLATILEVQLADLDVVLVVHWLDHEIRAHDDRLDLARKIAQDLDAAAVLMSDPSILQEVTVFVPDEQGGTLVSRTVGDETLGQEGRRAAFALITRSLLQAALERNPIVDRATAPPTAPLAIEDLSPAVSAPDPTPIRPGLWFAGGATVRLFSTEHPTLPALAARLQLGGPTRLAPFVAYEFGPGIRIDDEVATLHLTTHDITLGVAVDLLQRARFAGGMDLALGLGIWRWHAESRDVQLQANRGEPDAILGLVWTGRLDFVLTPWMTLSMGPGIRLLVINQDYSVLAEGQQRVILSPWTIQPHLSARLAFKIR